MAAEPVLAHRTANRWRVWGYWLLPGEGFSYLLHLRPREWPIVAAHTALGFLLASGLDLAGGGGWGSLLLALACWVFFLNGGTLALNSVFDRDRGDIGYLDAPPPPPPYLLAFASGLLAGGQLLALLLPPLFALAYALCLGLSVLYSVPPFRWKAVGGLDLLINAVGFGALTPLAGWAATGRPLAAHAVWLFVAFGFLFAGFYPLTQLYQLEEDQERGDRTFAMLVGGARPSLGVALASVGAAFGAFGAALARAPLPRLPVLLLLALAAWLAVLLPWAVRAEETSPEGHKRGMYAALYCWALTDLVVLVAFVL